jgi:hypothetical protein
VHYHAAAYISPRQLLCRKGGFSVLLREESGRWSVLSIYLSVCLSVCLSVYFSSYIGESHEQKGGRGLRRAFLCWLASSLSIETEFDSICCRAVSRVCRKHYAGCIFSLSLSPHSPLPLPPRSIVRSVGRPGQAEQSRARNTVQRCRPRPTNPVPHITSAASRCVALSGKYSPFRFLSAREKETFPIPLSFFLSFFLSSSAHTRRHARIRWLTFLLFAQHASRAQGVVCQGARRQGRAAACARGERAVCE